MGASGLVTTGEAASLLGYTVQHTRLLIRRGELPAQKLGRDWIIARESVEEYQQNFISQLSGGTSGPPIHDVVNVATVPQRSPFRYPGGKTWLVPTIRRWLSSQGRCAREIVEPFAGGGIVSLTAIFEGLVERATLCELDENVAAVWETILDGGADWLADRILSFVMTRESVARALEAADRSVREKAFAVLLRNRISRGGILAPGAGVVKRGENGRGLASRWYPETLARRILEIAARRDRIRFIRGDGMALVERGAGNHRAVFFLDPPYTVAGRRLYAHSEVDHPRLFDLAARLAGDFLMTYDDATQIRWFAYRHRFELREIVMKNTHHAKKFELLVGRDLRWLG